VRIVGVSGHRQIDEKKPGELVEFARLFVALSAADRIVTGMAIGWDLAVAQACHELGIPYTAAVPFIDQPSEWTLRDRKHWTWLMNQADRVIYVSTEHERDAYEKRNLWIVDNSGAMSILLEPGRERSGTGRCALYADRRGRIITPLWDRWKRFQQIRSNL